MNKIRNLIPAIAILLFLVWLFFHFGELTDDPDGTVRLVLGLIFSLMILARPKAAGLSEGSDPVLDRAPSGNAPPASLVPPILAVAGTALTVIGLVFDIGQAGWLGLLFLLYACLRWGLPAGYSRDIFPALFVLYWIHPLPGQIMGPLQLAMQKVSLLGSEWLLHCFNVRVWADGTLLLTGSHTFGIPEACSGMRTVSTVIPCALGLGILLRFKPREIAVLVIISLAQVLALNILRISSVVALSGGKAAAWPDGVLHDTTWLFLFAAVFATHAEAAWWRTVRLSRKSGGEHKPTILPPVQAALFRRRRVILVALLLVLIGASAGYKRRPYHRSMMIRDVVGNIILTDPERAERASSAALALCPRDYGLLREHIKVLLFRNKPEEATRLLDGFPFEKRDVEHSILRAWALILQGNPKAAAGLTESLPDDVKDHPAVAMIRAEFSAIAGDMDTVERNIAKAAEWDLMTPRIRALYPCLAACQQWEAIAASHSSLPYTDLEQAIIAIHAHMKLNKLAVAGKILGDALERWPGEISLVEYLAAMTVAMPDTEWERVFADTIKVNLNDCSPDDLMLLVESCLQISRPDLAWLVYRRLESISPEHPGVYLIPAQFENLWFTFRKRWLGIPTLNAGEEVDLKNVRSFRGAIAHTLAPLADDLVNGDPAGRHAEYIAAALRRFEQARRQGNLSLRMSLAYVGALELAGRHDEAHEQLITLEQNYPQNRIDLLNRHAVLYDRAGDWQQTYEALRELCSLTAKPSSQVSLTLINALMHLDMGVFAVTVADRAATAFPDSLQIAEIDAAVWATLGFPEEKLSRLQRLDAARRSRLLPLLLDQTERFVEAERIRNVQGMKRRAMDARKNQRLLLPEAELAVDGQWPSPLSPEEMSTIADTVAARALDSTSPFVRKLLLSIADWYRNAGHNGTSDPESWIRAARDELEQAMALHQLTILLARQERIDEARSVAGRAVRILPESVVMWRTLLLTGDADVQTAERARAACPDDSETWLAWLVARLRADGPGEWATSEIDRACSEGRLPIAAIVRAGDLFRRNEMKTAARRAAQFAVNNGQGFLPAYVLALRCSDGTGNTDQILALAAKAAENAVDPAPFHEIIASIGTLAATPDAATEAVLKRLVKDADRGPLWAERLYELYLQRGDSERAVRVLTSFAGDLPAKVDIRVLLRMAERARLAGHHTEAVRILRNARAMYPKSRVVLNNLVYTLALNREGLPEAQRLLPQLVGLYGNSFAALDTAAVVSCYAGELDKAEEYLGRAMEAIDDTDPDWFRSNPNAMGMASLVETIDPSAARQITPLVSRLVEKVQIHTAKP